MNPNRVLTPALCAGFTMLELVIVILIAGIVSFIAIGRLNDTGEVNAHGFAEQVASTLRFVQQAAVAQRRLMYVNVNAGTGLVNACLDSANPCATPLAAPGQSGAALSVQAPGGVVLTTSTAQFAFDPMGQPVDASSGQPLTGRIQLLATASDGQQFQVTVEAGSGYVRRS
jgi:MSHA pilin protein MshC